MISTLLPLIYFLLFSASYSCAPITHADRISVFSDDVNNWLSSETDSTGVARRLMFNNIHPRGTVPGIVIASTQSQNPNYYFHWVRDAALTMDYVIQLYNRGDVSQESIIMEYVSLVNHIQNQYSLGETKFNVDGTVFSGSWCRPQTDGAALTASALMRFANSYLDIVGNVSFITTELYDSKPDSKTAIKRALDFVATSWRNENSCDIWEEMKGSHFYNKMVQRKALMEGIAFAGRMGDFESIKLYSGQVREISDSLALHWDRTNEFIYASMNSSRSFRSGLDSSVILAAIHTDVPYGGLPENFSINDDRILATIPKLVDQFNQLFQINNIKTNSIGVTLGPTLGRYPEDLYDGNGSSRGNPWAVCTASLAEYYFRLARNYKEIGSFQTSNLNVAFFDFIGVAVEVDMLYSQETDVFSAVIRQLISKGDEIVRRLVYHSDNGRFREQFNRNYGFLQGAADITWVYSSILTIDRERSRLKSRMH